MLSGKSREGLVVYRLITREGNKEEACRAALKQESLGERCVSPAQVRLVTLYDPDRFSDNALPFVAPQALTRPDSCEPQKPDDEDASGEEEQDEVGTKHDGSSLCSRALHYSDVHTASTLGRRADRPVLIRHVARLTESLGSRAPSAAVRVRMALSVLRFAISRISHSHSGHD